MDKKKNWLTAATRNLMLVSEIKEIVLITAEMLVSAADHVRVAIVIVSIIN